MLSLLLGAWLTGLNPPAEYVIDCSTWPGAVKTRVSFSFVTRDGKRVEDRMVLFPDTGADAPVLGLTLVLKHYGWRYKILDRNRVVVWGSPTSAIRSVSFKTDGWVPTWERQARVPPSIAVPPRPAKGPASAPPGVTKDGTEYNP